MPSKNNGFHPVHFINHMIIAEAADTTGAAEGLRAFVSEEERRRWRIYPEITPKVDNWEGTATGNLSRNGLKVGTFKVKWNCSKPAEEARA